MQILTSLRRRWWSGRIASLPLSFFAFFSFFLFPLPRPQVALCIRSGPMRTPFLRKEVPFGDLNDVLLNFGGKTPQPQKLKFLGAWIGLSTLNDKKIQILITWIILSRSWLNFYREYAPRTSLRVWFHGSSQQIQDGGGCQLLNFGKMSITPGWIKIYAPNFMERCITAMRRLPHDRK